MPWKHPLEKFLADASTQEGIWIKENTRSGGWMPKNGKPDAKHINV